MVLPAPGVNGQEPCIAGEFGGTNRQPHPHPNKKNERAACQKTARPGFPSQEGAE